VNFYFWRKRAKSLFISSFTWAPHTLWSVGWIICSTQKSGTKSCCRIGFLQILASSWELSM